MNRRTGTAGRSGLGRSLTLFRAFLQEPRRPDSFYRLLAADTVTLLGRYAALPGLQVLDVGGGAGYLAEALEAAGAGCVTVDVDAAELYRRGNPPPSSVLADGRALPFPDASFDVTHASNVLEHVPDPWQLLAEMIRTARPGGLTVASVTTWYSPWGGHETSPWHYLGGERAARRYERRGRPPKNRFGTSLFPVRVCDVLQWARGHPDVDLVDAFPRYLPHWARLVVRVPGVREVVTWNLSVVLRRRW